MGETIARVGEGIIVSCKNQVLDSLPYNHQSLSHNSVCQQTGHGAHTWKVNIF